MREKCEYLDILGIPESSAVSQIAKLTSELTGEEHTIRSSIIELHFAVELEVRRLLYHLFKRTILYVDEEERNTKAAVLDKSVSKLPFGAALSLFEAGIKQSPWPDLQSIWALNATRNKLAHQPNLDGVTYKGRNPFTNKDCLAQMYFDVWAVKQAIPKFFDRVIEGPIYEGRYYFQLATIYEAKFGRLSDEELPQIKDDEIW